MNSSQLKCTCSLSAQYQNMYIYLQPVARILKGHHQMASTPRLRCPTVSYTAGLDKARHSLCRKDQLRACHVAPDCHWNVHLEPAPRPPRAEFVGPLPSFSGRLLDGAHVNQGEGGLCSRGGSRGDGCALPPPLSGCVIRVCLRRYAVVMR